jgi:hypothetical protein
MDVLGVLELRIHDLEATRQCMAQSANDIRQLCFGVLTVSQVELGQSRQASSRVSRAARAAPLIPLNVRRASGSNSDPDEICCREARRTNRQSPVAAPRRWRAIARARY